MFPSAVLHSAALVSFLTSLPAMFPELGVEESDRDDSLRTENAKVAFFQNFEQL